MDKERMKEMEREKGRDIEREIIEIRRVVGRK